MEKFSGGQGTEVEKYSWGPGSGSGKVASGARVRRWKSCLGTRSVSGRRKALITLPRGPQESTQSYYAGSRLGVYVCTVFLWGAGVGAPQVHYFISRCKEKSPPYSLSIWRHVLATFVNFAGVRDICWWSDGGKHFRANQPIATMSVRGVEHICKHSARDADNFSCDINFGVPSHFKNHCDGAQAQLKNILNELAKRDTISEMPQFIREARRLYTEFAEDKTRVQRMPAQFHDYFPLDLKSRVTADYTICFAPATFIEPIMVCQTWSCRLNDKRRRNDPTFLNGADVFTALDFRAAMLRDGTRVPADRSCHPRKLNVADAAFAMAAAEEAEEGEEAMPVGELAAEFHDVHGEHGNGLIAMATTLHNEWQCSYRSVMPEKKAFSAWRDRWTRHRLRWQASRVKLVGAQERRPVAEQLALQRGWKAKRKVVPR